MHEDCAILNRKVKNLKAAKEHESLGESLPSKGTNYKCKGPNEDYSLRIQGKARRPEWLKSVGKRGKQREMRLKKPGPDHTVCVGHSERDGKLLEGCEEKKVII